MSEPNPFVLFDELVEQEQIDVRSPLLRRTKVPDSVLPKVKNRFLELFTQCGLIKDAAAAVGVSVATVFSWRAVDADFAENMDIIRRHKLIPLLEDAAFERAMSGKSDMMLVALLKNLKPDIYDEKSREKPPPPALTLRVVDVNGKSLGEAKQGPLSAETKSTLLDS